MILLRIPANPSASIACDMTSAPDTFEDRIAEYGRLFAHALVERRRDSRSVTLSFRDEPGVAEWAQDLVRREAACCPFVDYRIERQDARIVWTIAGPDDPTVQAIVDLWLNLPETFEPGEPADESDVLDEV